MNAGRTGSSETVYFELTDLRPLQARLPVRVKNQTLQRVRVRSVYTPDHGHRSALSQSRASGAFAVRAVNVS